MASNNNWPLHITTKKDSTVIVIEATVAVFGRHTSKFNQLPIKNTMDQVNFVKLLMEIFVGSLTGKADYSVRYSIKKVQRIFYVHER